MPKTKIVVCLKTGDKNEFTSEHVYKIRDMCVKHISLDYDFYCLTNETKLDCNIIPLEHNWPGWWSKFELYKIPGPVFYVDLDTIILNNIDDIVLRFTNTSFSCLCNFHRNIRKLNSSIIGWKDNALTIYDEFTKTPCSEMLSTFCTSKNRFFIKTDQHLLQYIVKKPNVDCTLVDLGGDIFSFKYEHIEAKQRSSKYKDGWRYKKIAHFHGSPRPWEQNIIPY